MSSTPKLKLRLTPAAEKAVRRGHPWVYSDRIRNRNREGGSGELAIIYDRNDKFMAIGLYDPASPIRVRILHAGPPVQLNHSWWEEHLRRPIEKRRALFSDDHTNGYRCINGESDGWPALVLDRYADRAVLKLYSAAWFPHLDRITALVLSQLQPSSLILRLSRNIQNDAGKRSLSDGQILTGDPVEAPVVFRENGLRFEADLQRGQKTGFFLDQRDNRLRVRQLANGRRVLNAFSHTGGFSVYAAAGGASSSVDLDISQHALDAARRNIELNASDSHVKACHYSSTKADAFRWMADQSDSAFDLVVVDPPSLAKRASEKLGAIAAYQKLAGDALRLLGAGGILVSASCSAHVTAEEFFQAVREAARSRKVRVQEMESALHAPDHPATIPEAQYLKCIYLKKQPTS